MEEIGLYSVIKMPFLSYHVILLIVQDKYLTTGHKGNEYTVIIYPIFYSAVSNEGVTFLSCQLCGLFTSLLFLIPLKLKSWIILYRIIKR